MDTGALRPPVTLEGRRIRLVPLDRAQLLDLNEAGRFPEIWQYMVSGRCDRPDSMASFVDLLLARQASGTDLAFTVVEKQGGRAVGMTRYLNIEIPNRSLEVGGSWLTPARWRTPLNTDAKRQMLGYAFEVVGVHRVQIKTDVRNMRSQRAIERLGATREGVLRDHMVTPEGTYRTSVVYSILADDWPTTRARLDTALDRPWAADNE